jgi:hypothetical protein
MRHYRIYTVGQDGHFAGAADVVCADDQEAIRKAQQAVNGNAVELWEAGRFIVRFPSDDA